MSELLPTLHTSTPSSWLRKEKRAAGSSRPLQGIKQLYTTANHCFPAAGHLPCSCTTSRLPDVSIQKQAAGIRNSTTRP
jgi:hypothetical protein